jgi:hypothetical protein
MSGEKLPPADRIKSRRRLLIALALIFALWVAMMLVMYFSTVYPHRHPATSPTSSLTVVPG